jgi:hypothetical protein
MYSTAAAREVSETSTTASAGSPTLATASRRTEAMAVLDVMAPDEPRRKAALPALRHRPAASLVTLGRFS